MLGRCWGVSPADEKTNNVNRHFIRFIYRLIIKELGGESCGDLGGYLGNYYYQIILAGALPFTPSGIS